MLRGPDGKEHICINYTITNPQGRCRIYDKRPQVCRDFPRSPMDLERVSKWCTLRFFDEKGRVIDAQMDTSVKLTPLKA